jgi:hypothetical protein
MDGINVICLKRGKVGNVCEGYLELVVEANLGLHQFARHRYGTTWVSTVLLRTT